MEIRILEIEWLFSIHHDECFGAYQIDSQTLDNWITIDSNLQFISNNFQSKTFLFSHLAKVIVWSENSTRAHVIMKKFAVLERLF